MEHNFSFSVPSSLFAGIFVKFMKIEMVEQHQPSSNSPSGGRLRAEAACIIKEECIKWDFKLSHLTGSSNSSSGSRNCNCNSAGHYK